jgi:NADH:ubiquinone oxidoreductase subunit K
MNPQTLQLVFGTVFILLGVGFYGMLASRNLIKLIIALQLLVKAGLLGLVAAGQYSGQLQLGQSLALSVIVADTVVAVVAMALAVQIKRRVGSLDVQAIARLRG